MSQPAVRHEDPLACPPSFAPASEITLDASTTRRVRINGRLAGRQGSTCNCGCRAPVVTGAATVKFNARCAARVGESTANGTLTTGSPNVRIGGPSAGGVFGNFEVETRACFAAAAGRKEGIKQSHGNCGLESWRNLINHERVKRRQRPLSEDDLLEWMLAQDIGTDNPGAHNHGAQNAYARVQILKAQGIPAFQQPQTTDNLALYVSRGHAVSVSIHPTHWGGGQGARDPNNPDVNLHEVAVTAVEYDATGKLSAFYINDTGLPACALRIPAAQMAGLFETAYWMTVSEEVMWR